MGRSERRLAERNRKALARQIGAEIKRQAVQEVENGRVEAMMLCFCLAAHEELGCDIDDCLKLLNKLDDYMGVWVRDEATLQQLADKVRDEVGIVIKTD